MFDNQKIAKQIKQARIDKNMTQMNLADAMGVSYQAVSNWERGNSLPDISKLEQLCTALDLSVSELLGVESKAVEKAMDDAPMTLEELVEAAPMLPPETVRKQMEARQDQKTIRLSELADLAPSLEESYLDQLLRDADVTDFDCLDEIAPFVSRETLDSLVDRADPKELEAFDDVLCYMSKEAIGRLILRCFAVGNTETIEEAAAFASKEGLNALVEAYGEAAQDREFPDICCFLSKESVGRLLVYAWKKENVDLIEEAAVYASREGMTGLVEEYTAEETVKEFPDIFPFLGKDNAKKLAKYWLEKRETDYLSDLAPYL